MHPRNAGCLSAAGIDCCALANNHVLDWGYHIPAGQRRFARQLIDAAGVNVVHGHSSHHPRGIEVYREKPILYGCGDFLNDYEGIGGQEAFRGDLTLMYFLTLDPASGRLLRLSLVPLQIRRFRLHRPSAADAAWLREVMARECGRLGTTVAGAGSGRWPAHGDRAGAPPRAGCGPLHTDPA